MALSVLFVFNAGIVAVAFLFSAIVGVALGYSPATKAARLDRLGSQMICLTGAALAILALGWLDRDRESPKEAVIP